MSALPVIHSSRHVGHDPAVEIQGGIALPAFDRVERVERIVDALARDLDGYTLAAASTHGLEGVLAVHSEEIVDHLAHAWERLQGSLPAGAELLFADTFWHAQLRPEAGSGRPSVGGLGDLGIFCFDTITGIGPRTYDAALGAVDVALTASDVVLAGAPAAFGLTRPPGHHVSRSLFGGGCYLNNAAIAAEYLIARRGGRVAVLDVDFHHGNGTQSLFYERGDVLYASLHGAPPAAWPYLMGYAEERGAGAGEGTTINVPLEPGTDGGAYRRQLHKVLEAVSSFGAIAVVVSLGVDTFTEDPTGNLCLGPEDLSMVGGDVSGLGLPCVLLLEGGYAIEHLGENVRAWLDGFRTRQVTG